MATTPETFKLVLKDKMEKEMKEKLNNIGN